MSSSEVFDRFHGAAEAVRAAARRAEGGVFDRLKSDADRLARSARILATTLLGEVRADVRALDRKSARMRARKVEQADRELSRAEAALAENGRSCRDRAWPNFEEAVSRFKEAWEAADQALRFRLALAEINDGPDPFNPQRVSNTLTARYDARLRGDGQTIRTEWRILSTSGAVLRRILAETPVPGRHDHDPRVGEVIATLVFDGRDDAGAALVDGTYSYRVTGSILPEGRGRDDEDDDDDEEPACERGNCLDGYLAGTVTIVQLDLPKDGPFSPGVRKKRSISKQHREDDPELIDVPSTVTDGGTLTLRFIVEITDRGGGNPRDVTKPEWEYTIVVNKDVVELARTLAAEAGSEGVEGLRAVANTMKNRVENGTNEPEDPSTGLQGHKYRIRGHDFRNAAFHITDDETRSFRDQLFDTAQGGGYAPQFPARVEDTTQEAREVAASVLSSPATIVDNVNGAMHFRTSTEAGYTRTNPDFIPDILDFAGDLQKVRVARDNAAHPRVRIIFYAPTDLLILNSSTLRDPNEPTLGYIEENEAYRDAHPQDPLGPGKTVDDDLP